MIANTAGPPEVRCIICGVPAGFSDSHPNVKHSLLVELAVWEYRLGLFMRRIKGWF